LSGQIRAYAASRLPRGKTVPAPDAKVLVHQLVRATSCGKRQIFLPGENWKKTQPGTAAYVLAAAENRGECIRSVETTADRLVSPRFIAFLDHGDLDHRESALFIDTLMRTSRATFYERTDAGGLSPVYQDTRVSYSLLQPLLAYHLSFGDISNVKPRWWRKPTIVNRAPEARDYLYSVLGAQIYYQ
jgi:hypothetical protein